MEKKECQAFFREQMKALGFKTRGNYAHKMVEDDYLVGVWLDHASFSKAYYIVYGVIYMPDEKRLPFKGWVDWHRRFTFTTDPSDDLGQYPIENLNGKFGKMLTDLFEYENRTFEDLGYSIKVNFEKRVLPVFDQSYVLDIYRNDWIEFRRVPYDTVRKLAGLMGIDAEKVIEFRDSRLTKHP